MVRVARLVFAGAAWILFAALILQVFLAGVGLFVSGDDSFALHRVVGYLLSLAPILVLGLAFAARAPRATAWFAGGLAVLAFVQSALPSLRDGLPLVAALHPVNALAVVWLSWQVAGRATSLVRAPMATPAGSPAGSPAGGV
jgi:mercuric ion transport protein